MIALCASPDQAQSYQEFGGSGKRQGSVFVHFLLPRVATAPLGGDTPFKDHPLFRLDLLTPQSFGENASQVDFFERNSGFRGFSSIRPSGYTMYDSMSQTQGRLVVMLTGAIWQAETLASLEDMGALARHYNHEDLNYERLITAYRDWFYQKVKTGHRYSELRRFLASRLSGLSAYQKSHEFREFENLASGPSYFMPSNVFQLIHDQVQLLRKRAFAPNVNFVFLQSGGPVSDSSEYLKEAEDLFPLVYDEQGEESMGYVDTRIPTMTLVNQQGVIMYQGQPLPLQFLKTRIDRLLIPVYEQVGMNLAAENHKRRVKEMDDLRERELARRREIARQQAESSTRGEAFKKRQSSDPSVNRVDVRSLNFH